LLSSFVFDFGSDGKAAIAELNMSKDRDQTALSDSGEVVDGTGAPVQQLRKVVNGPFR